MNRQLSVMFTILLFFLIVPVAGAAKTMKLLAVSETPAGYVGSTADLILEVKPGTGRIFIDTYPLSKLDTQISTRFANEIACNEIKEDCGSYDFFYTINADTSIIGGPSAGAAISILTIAELRNLSIGKNTAITGTINSGGLIGPVGGLKSKIDAAADANITKVLIPKGEKIIRENFEGNASVNVSIDLAEYGRQKGVEIIEVGELNDALYYFSGKRMKEELDNRSIKIDGTYSQTMKTLAVTLCRRSDELLKTVSTYDIENETMLGQKLVAINLSIRANNSFSTGDYYSSASYCFGANVKLRFVSYAVQGIKNNDIVRTKNDLESQLSIIDSGLGKREIKTLTDLQTYMIVKQRILEARDSLDSIEQKNSTVEKIYELSYAQERVLSADSWSIFFGKGGLEFKADKEAVRKSCISKIAEAEERVQYVNLFFPLALEESRKDIENAKSDFKNNEYLLCLFKASKAKAEADLIVGVLGVDEKQINDILQTKESIVRKNIVENIDTGVFPILGYSYYEYAKSLVGEDKYSALLYFEYALELNNLDIYFKEQKTSRAEAVNAAKPAVKISNEAKMWIALASGVIMGLVVGMIIGMVQWKKKEKKKKQFRKKR